LTVVHAIPCAVAYDDSGPIPVAAEEIREARSRATYLFSDGVQADVVVEDGLPDQVTVNVARRQNASIIVLGLRSHTSAFVAEHLPWTTAHRVVCDAHCPVMTVR
jgi:nucleotide-binding universal stress UspA family protein